MVRGVLKSCNVNLAYFPMTYDDENLRSERKLGDNTIFYCYFHDCVVILPIYTSFQRCGV